MPANLKRKGSPGLDEDSESSKRRLEENSPKDNVIEEAAEENTVHDDTARATQPAEQPIENSGATEQSPAEAASSDRAARFAALRARNQASRKANLAETKNESRRAATDPSQLTALHRKRDVAAHKLLKADVEADGEDFERKRAWDWTIDESEKWDERVKEKQRRREEVAFRDYASEAGKVYERQVNGMGKEGFDERKEAYEREKRDAIDRAVKGGGLEIVEAEDGELIAVDRDGSFYSTADAMQNGGSGKPDKAAVDRLVNDIKKAEEVRLKKRRERGLKDDGGEDVSYINEKNKQFNMKLARFYDKYTGEIRESFERGTAM